MLFTTVLAVLMLGTVSLSSDPQQWRVINDGVMGGVSSSRIDPTADGMRFSGTLSLENNGGFASMRTLVQKDVSGASAVRISVRGDGRRYQFRLRTSDRFDGAAWVAEFDTSDEWQTITLPLSEFTAQFRGRRLSNMSDLDSSAIRQVGILLADKNPGSFHVEIRSIEFTGDSTGQS